MPKSEQDAFARSEVAGRVYDLLVRMAAKRMIRVQGLGTVRSVQPSDPEAAPPAGRG